MWVSNRVFAASVVVDEGGGVLWLSAKKHGSSFQEVCTFTWSHLASSSIRVDSLP